MSMQTREAQLIQTEEAAPNAVSGMAVLALLILVTLASTVSVIAYYALPQIQPALLATGIVAFCLTFFFYPGLKVLKPNEALVLTLFGKYIGTLRGPGFFFVNPFAVSVNPSAGTRPTTGAAGAGPAEASAELLRAGFRLPAQGGRSFSHKISLKASTLNNDKQKINDSLGNPIIIGIVVIWRVVNTAKAVFNVDNYVEYLSIQCDSALRNIVRLYPYDSTVDGEASLRGSAQEIADRLRDEIQQKADIAGLEIMEARITSLAYAPEIAAAMLQRQQASAVIDARQMIVDGAVGMVEMALARLSENNVVQLDEERKAAMVSNLLVVLCAGKDAQPVVNSGSLY